jgi:GTP-binding protein Era
LKVVDFNTPLTPEEIAAIPRVKKVAVVTKIDTTDKQAVGEQLLAVQKLGQELGIDWAELVPVSAVADNQVDLLSNLLMDMLPEGQILYPDGELTDEPELIMIAELIRESALEGVHDELPHSIAVVIDEMAMRADRPDDKPLMDIYALIYVERESQKHIVIGKGGIRLKEVGTEARIAISKLLGVPVYLDIRVKIAKDWQRDPKQLSRLGF